MDRISLLILILVTITGLATWVYSHKISIPPQLFDRKFIGGNSPPDEFLVVPPESFDWEMVAVGREFAKSEGKLLVVSLVRDCVGSIPCMETKMAVLGRIFREVHLVLFENNSKDNTRRELLEYAHGKRVMGGGNIKVTLVNPFTMGENETLCESSSKTFTNDHKCGRKGASNGRIGRMAILRNRILGYVYEHQSGYSTLLMTDMDIIGRWFPTGIEETVGYLRSKPGIGFVTFRGSFPTGGFFDPFSYKGEDVTGNSDISTLLFCMKSYFTMPSGRGLYPVRSSHSGGIFSNLPLPPDLEYKVRNIVDGPFGISVNLCEHIPLMETVPNNFVNTNMSFLVKDNV